jgi:hypothetical protein
MTQFHHDSHTRPKAELLEIMQRLGMPADTIAEIDSKLPEVVDMDECGAVLQSYGLTRDAAMSALGASP